MAKDSYYKNVTIQYNGDTTKLSAALRQINAEMGESKSAARALDSALQLDPKGVNLLEQRTQRAREQVQLTEQRLAALRDAAGKATDPVVVRRIAEQASVAEARLADLREELTRLEAQSGPAGQLAQGMREFGESVRDAGEAVSAVGDQLTMGLTALLAAIGALAVNAATNIDSALTDVKKTVDGTAEQYEGLREAAVEYSKVNAVSADEILQVEALGAQLGYDITQVEEFGRVVSGLDIATNMDAETAGTNLAQFANIVGMSKDETENYGSTIVALGNSMATTESDISNMAMRIAAAGSQIGMGEADILGLAAALSSVGMEAEAGGTAISTIMSKIDSDIATGSEAVATWASAAGMSAQAFAEAWRTDPVQALSSLLAGLNQAAEGGGNMSVMLDELGVSSIRQTDALKRLAGNCELLPDAVRKANDAWTENTALTEEVANRNDSLAGKMEMLQNRVTALLEKVGRPVADALLAILDAANPMFETIEGAAQAFADLDEGTQRAIVTAVALVAAGGPVLSLGGRLVSTIGGVVSAMGSAVEGAQLLSVGMQEGLGVMGSLSVASESLMTAATGLAGVGIPAVLAAVGLLVSAYQQWQEHNELVRSATEGLSEATQAAGEAYEAYAQGSEAAVRSAEAIREANEEALQAVADFADRIRDTMEDVGTNAAMAEAYADTMKELGNQGSVTGDELAKLKNAVEEYNSITGAAVEVTDEQTGALNLLPGQIDEVTAAYRRQAEQQAYAELYKDALKEQMRNQKELDTVTKELAASEKELVESYKNHASGTGDLVSRTNALRASEK